MLEDMPELPTAEQCVTFHRVINEGRVAVGLEPLRYLEFDEAVLADPHCCLSATNLFAEAGYDVLAGSILARHTRARKEVMTIAPEEILPVQILKVTDYFDSVADEHSEHLTSFECSQRLTRLRERMVEAGVVAP